MAGLSAAGIRIDDAPRQIQRTDNAVIVSVASGQTHEVDVIYPALGCTIRSELACEIGAVAGEAGTLKVDEHQQTAVKGLFAAGDVVSDLHQLSVALGHAALAATAIHNALPRNAA